MNMNLEKYLKLRYIYILSILFCIYLTYIFRVDISFDSPSYINAWQSFREGQIDIWRTPVYPVFLGLMHTLLGDNYLYYVVGVQHLMFLVSIRYFYLLLRYSITNLGISYFLTLFYALYPCAATYNCCIATETFAITGSIFLLYSIFKLYRTKELRFGIYTFLWLFFLVFLRPAVVYLLPVTIVSWCIVAIKRKRFFISPVINGLTASIIVSIFLIAYMAIFKGTYGVFTPSGIGLINKYAIAKAANIIEYNSTGNGGLQFYREVENGIDEMGMEAFTDFVNQSISRNKGKYVMRLFQNIRNASEDYLFDPSYQIGGIGIVSNILGFRIKILYCLFLLYAIILVRWVIKQKEIAFFSSILFMIGVSNFVLIIIASPGEFGRLTLPAIPTYLIMFGQLFDMIKIKKISEIEFV